MALLTYQAITVESIPADVVSESIFCLFRIPNDAVDERGIIVSSKTFFVGEVVLTDVDDVVSTEASVGGSFSADVVVGKAVVG